MLAKKYRFHGLNALNFAYRQGQTARAAEITLKYIKNSRQDNFRAAVVVSKKVEKTAVGRNLIRRKIFAAIEKYQKRIIGPYDLIFSVFNANLADMPAEKLEAWIENLLSQAGVIE